MNPSESNISNAATTLRKTIFRIFGSGLRPVLMIGRRDSEKGPAAGCLVQISDSKASKAHLLTGLQPHPSKRQQIRGGFNFGLTATKGLVFVLDGSFRGDRCRIERVSRK